MKGGGRDRRRYDQLKTKNNKITFSSRSATAGSRKLNKKIIKQRFSRSITIYSSVTCSVLAIQTRGVF